MLLSSTRVLAAVIVASAVSLRGASGLPNELASARRDVSERSVVPAIALLGAASVSLAQASSNGARVAGGVGGGGDLSDLAINKVSCRATDERPLPHKLNATIALGNVRTNDNRQEVAECVKQYGYAGHIQGWAGWSCGGRGFYAKSRLYKNPDNCIDACRDCLLDMAEAGKRGAECSNTVSALQCWVGFHDPDLS